MWEKRKVAVGAGLVLVIVGVTDSGDRPVRSAPSPISSMAGSGDRRHPLPTEIAEEHDELLLNRSRESWIESLHRADPLTDWRAVEKRNWERILLLRNESALTPLTSPWTEVGSTNQAGRTRQSVYEATSGRLFIGADLGGIWRGDFNPASPNPGSMNWTPLADNIYGGAKGIVIVPGSPSTILKTQFGFFSGEIHRTTDGGATWSVVASLNGQIKRLVGSASSSTTVFALVRDCCSPHSDLYRSTNSGASFQLLRTFSSYEADVWVPRTGSGSLYLLTDNRIEVSTNQGTSWSIRGTIPFASASRASLTGSEAGMPRLYAVAMLSDESNRRLFRSDDAGVTWTDRGSVTDFWGDHTSLAASSRNANLILYGGLECWRSTNGGVSFQHINGWGDYYGNPAARLHADIDSIDFVALSGGTEALFIGTDGGTYFSGDGGANVSNLSLQGLRVGQYYATLSDAMDPSLVAGGSQDQGYQVGPTSTGQLTQVISGDYGQLTSPDRTHRLVFSSYPAFVLAVEKQGSSYNVYTQDYPSGEDHYWMAPLAADPRSSNVVYLGARHLYKYQLAGGVWTVSALPFNFQGQAGEFVSAIAIAPSDGNRWYVATNMGRFFYSSNGGSSWTLSAFSVVPSPQYLTGLAIAVQPTNPSVVAIGGSGYSNPAVYLSTNGGVSFSSLESGQPQTLVTDLAWGPAPALDLYAATESGPWRFLSGAQTWESLLATDAPMTNYWSVEAAGNRMRFGTYGRGVWDFSPCLTSPTGRPDLTLVKTPGSARLDWTAVATSMGYDLVRGNLGLLHSSGGNFSSSTTACLANDTTARTWSDSLTPGPGDGVWYLVRAMNCAGSGTYDSGAPSQIGSRDAEIQTSAGHCP